MSDDINFVPRLDGTGSLGRTNKRWNEVHATTYHGDGSSLTGLTIDQVTGAAPADNYLTTYENTAGALDILAVGNTVTVDTDLTYTPGQYITITLRIDNSLSQLSRVVSYNALSGQLQYAAPYSMGAGVANGNTSHEGPWDINIAETPTPRYTAQSTANGLRTTPTPGQPGSGGNALGFGAAGQITLGFDLQYEAGDYVKMAEYDDLSDYQIAEVVSYDTETGILVFDTPTIVEGSTSAHDQIFTATLAVAEEVRATAAEETLQANIDAEETARIAADALLQTQINNISGSGGSATMGGTMTAHIIPDSNAAYDLGNAEYKIRHLFLSDNSLWVGDDHKISIGDDGKMKFRKRKDQLPLELRNLGINEAGASLKRVEELAIANGLEFENLFQDNDDFDEESDETALTALQDQVNALGASIPDVSGFVTTAEVPDVSGFATTSELIDVTAQISTQQVGILNFQMPSRKIENKWIKVATLDGYQNDKPNTAEILLHLCTDKHSPTFQDTRLSSFRITAVASYGRAGLHSSYTGMMASDSDYVYVLNEFGKSDLIVDVMHHLDTDAAFDPATDIKMVQSQSSTEIWFKINYDAQDFTKVIVDAKMLAQSGEDTWSLCSNQNGQTTPTQPTSLDPGHHAGGEVFGSYANKKFDNLFVQGDLTGPTITNLQNSIPDISNLATTAEIPDVSGFATTAEIPDVSGFVLTTELPGVSTLVNNDTVGSSWQPDEKVWLKIATNESTTQLADHLHTSETTLLVTIVSADIGSFPSNQRRDQTFLINVQYTHGSYNGSVPYYLDTGTRVTCDHIGSGDIEDFDPSTDLVLNTGQNGAELWIRKAHSQASNCYVSILGGVNQDEGSSSVKTDEGFVIATDQPWKDSIDTTTPSGTRRDNVYGSWANKVYTSVTAANFIGDGSQLTGIGIDALGGLSIAETYLHSSSNTNGTGYWYLTTTEEQKHYSQEVTFTAPANGKIKFSATMILAGLPAAEPNGAVVYAGVYDQGASAYVVDSAGITLSSRQVWQCVPSDNATQTVEYNIDGLTPGQSYTYQLHLKSNIGDVVTVHIYAAPMIIKAVTLP